jgi:hypothetical protein
MDTRHAPLSTLELLEKLTSNLMTREKGMNQEEVRDLAFQLDYLVRKLSEAQRSPTERGESDAV